MMTEEEKKRRLEKMRETRRRREEEYKEKLRIAEIRREEGWCHCVQCKREFQVKMPLKVGTSFPILCSYRCILVACTTESYVGATNYGDYNYCLVRSEAIHANRIKDEDIKDPLTGEKISLRTVSIRHGELDENKKYFCKFGKFNCYQYAHYLEASKWLLIAYELYPSLRLKFYKDLSRGLQEDLLRSEDERKLVKDTDIIIKDLNAVERWITNYKDETK